MHLLSNTYNELIKATRRFTQQPFLTEKLGINLSKRHQNTMLTVEELENLCSQQESNLLDFKQSFYDFKLSTDDKGTAAFVKDLMAMANTVRTQSGYIIFGVKSNPGVQASYVGLESICDEAILQDKIKSKLVPRPLFYFYSIVVKGVKIGVLEVPVKRYDGPISATIKMKGIEAGKFYHRMGSSNTEALGNEVILINDWIKNVPGSTDLPQKKSKLSQLLREVTDTRISLSVTMASIFIFAKEFEIQQLEQFCKDELLGLSSGSNQDGGTLDHRKVRAFVSYSSITINRGNFSISQIKQAFMNEKNIIETDVLFSKPISAIENMIKDFEKSNGQKIATLTMSSSEFLPDESKEHQLTIYFFPDVIDSLYSRIRQKAIELLMRL